MSEREDTRGLRERIEEGKRLMRADEMAGQRDMLLGQVDHLRSALAHMSALYREAVGVPESEHQRRRMDAVATAYEAALARAEKAEAEVERLASLRLLDAAYPPQCSPGDTPRWDADPVVARFGWAEGRCGRCGEEISAEAPEAEATRDDDGGAS